MKKIFILAIILLLYPVISYSQPSIVFDEEIYDFGKITPRDEIGHTFEFKNAGDQDLRIEKLLTK